MRRKPPEPILNKIRKLGQVARELSEGANFSITRLTSLKSLCEDPKVTAHFALYLARRTRETVNKISRPQYLSIVEWKAAKELIGRAVEQLGSYLSRPSSSKREALWQLLRELKDVNNEYKSIPYGTLRTIKNRYVLIVEDAAQCALSPYSAPAWAYHLARDYTECYDPRYGRGLIPESAPLVKDIVDFWCDYYSIDRGKL